MGGKEASQDDSKSKSNDDIMKGHPKALLPKRSLPASLNVLRTLPIPPTTNLPAGMPPAESKNRFTERLGATTLPSA